MTGYDEARDWLRANAPEWRIGESTQRLVPSNFVGGPTLLHYEVTLKHYEEVSRYGGGWLTLVGEGSTMLEAVSNAIGSLR